MSEATEAYLDEPMQVPGSAAAGSIVIPYDKLKKETRFEADESLDAQGILIEDIGMGTLSQGRQKGRKIRKKKGRYIRPRSPEKGENLSDIALDATLRAAALRSSTSDAIVSSITVLPGDIRVKERINERNILIIFILDSSDSMGKGEGMKAAKGAILSLLTKAYQKRYRVALVSFSHEKAEILLEPTGSIALARRKLRRLPTSGATPFADGLMKAWQIVKSERFKNPAIAPLLVFVSDGEANVPLRYGIPALDELYFMARQISKDGLKSLVIDTKPNDPQSDLMLNLAQKLGGDYYHIDRLKGASREIGGKIHEMLQDNSRHSKHLKK